MTPSFNMVEQCSFCTACTVFQKHLDMWPSPASLQHIDETFLLPQRREPRNEADVTAFTWYNNYL